LTRALVAAAWLLPAAELTAGTGVWTGGGPEGGKVVQFLANPAAPDLLYAQTATNAIFLQRTGSTKWQRAGLSLPPLIRDVALATDGTLYAAEASTPRLWRSVDHGATWEERPAPAAVDELRSIAAAGGMPSRVYLTASKYGAGVRLYRSDDGGSSWSSIALLQYGSVDLFADPEDLDIVYSEPVSGPVARSDDGGATWASTGIVRALSLLALDPANPEVLYTITPDSQVMTSPDRGATWAQVGTIQSDGWRPDYLALDPTDPHRLAAAYVSRIFLSENGGSLWREVESLPPVYASALAFDPRSPGRLLAGSAEGVHAKVPSANGSWKMSNQGLRARSASVLWAARSPAGLVLQADYSMGPWRSTDGGATWSLAASGLEVHGPWYRALDGESTGAFLYLGNGSGLHRSRDRGNSWELVGSDPTPGGWLGATLAAVDPFGALLWGGLTMGPAPAAARSEDHGETWSPFYFPPGFWITSPEDVAVDSTVAGRGFVGSYVYPGLCAVDRTEDVGTSWLRLLDVGPCTVVDVALDSRHPERVYVLGRGYAPNDARPGRYQTLLRSLDGGDTWEAIGEELPCFRSLALDPTNSDLYLGCDQIYVSRDHGETWSPFSTTGLPPDLGLIGALTFAFQDDRLRLYAATNVGVYSYTWPEP
jgi:photosystem II stability/assembly factor-like uncharacterized protein